MPFFSIVIPTYNRATFLSTTINSVLNQSFQDFELIIVDDGSTDSTKQTILSISKNDVRVRYIYQENSERGSARNNGIKNSNGEYIVFLDSDDEMHNDHLEKLKSIIQSNPDLNFLANKYQTKRFNKTIATDLSKLSEGRYDYHLFIKGNPLAVNFCVKRNNPKLIHFQENRDFAAMEDWIFLFQNLRDDFIYLSNFETLTLSDHDERSMRIDNKNIIQKKINATKWIRNNIKLDLKNIEILNGSSDHFCAIHSYADNHRKDALSFWFSSVKKLGIHKDSLVLLIKILVGYNFIQKIK